MLSTHVHEFARHTKSSTGPTYNAGDDRNGNIELGAPAEVLEPTGILDRIGARGMLL